MAQTTGKKNASQGRSGNSQDAIALLKADHLKVHGLFGRYEKADADEDKQKLAHEICKELIIHATIEEEIFYPACRNEGVEEEVMDCAQVEHDELKVLVGALIDGTPGDEFYDAKVKVLAENVEHHVGDEERPRTGTFARAKAAGLDMVALGQELQARKQELMGEIDENNLEPPEPKSLRPLGPASGQEMHRAPRH